MKKNKVSTITIFFLLLLSAAATTMAYFTYWKMFNNTFSVGENKIKITEEYIPPKEMQEGDNIYKKKVQIENTGTVPCYVRVFTEFSDSTLRDTSFLSPNGSDYYPANQYKNHLPEEWVYITDEENALLGGYYYYTKPLNQKAVTVPLFKTVKTHFETANEIKDYEIIVYAESVQVLDKNGSAFEGDTPYTAAWTEFLERR